MVPCAYFKSFVLSKMSTLRVFIIMAVTIKLHKI